MDLHEICDKVNSAGGKMYLVGGAVRDMILGLAPHDMDFAITGLSAKEFSSLFPNAFLRGKDFPVFDIDGTEFALARKERKIGEGHKGFECITDKSLTIVDDLERRDLTINSMAIDFKTKELIDPFGGREDLQNKVIRATSNAFLEDPLRTYRAARFAAKLGFKVEPKTIELMQKTRGDLANLSGDRVSVEFRKALMTHKPSIFFEVLKEAELLDVHFVEVYNLIGQTQPEKYHPEGDAYNHTMQVLDRIAEAGGDELARFSGLVHDFGKADTPKEELPRHIGHEEKGIVHVNELCNRVSLPTSFKKCGIIACREHMKAGIYSQMRDATKVDFLTRVGKSFLGLERMELLANADNTKPEHKIRFAKIGNRILNEINAKNYPCSEMSVNAIKERLRRERIALLKEIEKEEAEIGT